MWKPDVSVVVVTGLALDALKLCVATLKATTVGSLEIVLVLCNAANDVKKWAYQQKHGSPTTENPVVVSVYNPRGQLDVYGSYNYGVERATGDVVCLVNDDMVFAPDWDTVARKKLEEGIIMTGVVVEPGFVSVSELNIAYNFGMDPSHFKESEFREMAQKHRKPEVTFDTRGWYMPAMFFAKDFLALGGYNTARPFPHHNDVDFFRQWTAAGNTTARCNDMLCYHFQRYSQRPAKKLYWGHEPRDGWVNALDNDSSDVTTDWLSGDYEQYGSILCDGVFDEYDPASLEEILQSLYNLLTPGGVLVVEFDNILSKMLAFKRANDEERYGPDGLIVALIGTAERPLYGGYTPEFLLGAVKIAGFMDVKVQRGHGKEHAITAMRPVEDGDASPGSDS